MFGKKREGDADSQAIAIPPDSHLKTPELVICSSDVEALKGLLAKDETLSRNIAERAPGAQLNLVAASAVTASVLSSARSVFALFVDPPQLTTILDAVRELRKLRNDDTPALIIATRLDRLTAFGGWLEEMAQADKLEGIRLTVGNTIQEVLNQCDLIGQNMFGPAPGSNIIRMPVSPEVPDSGWRHLYIFSPQLKRIVKFTKELALNGVRRIYLLGAPGAGKSSIAYYYYVSRGTGNYVQINLTAESTGDKAAMKSLLCGHVSGAFAGSGSREGALSFAKDGVCFLDESHGVTGVVMQVLMEVLDSGQFLPFGATAKRSVDCAVIFASNRSWETLRGMIHLDEHARLGATLIKIPDLVARREDMIAVLATTLAKFKKQCRTWRAAEGITESAWNALQACPWRGNTRTLIRVAETASVASATSVHEPSAAAPLLDLPQIQEGLALWEPQDEAHPDDNLYVSYR